MKIFAPAKINLSLDILKKDLNGYHQVQTVVHQLDTLYDELEIKASKERSVLAITKGAQKTATHSVHAFGHSQQPVTLSNTSQNNLAFQALELIKKTFKIKKHVQITIIKNIPLSSGLGGGSSNAAAVLKGLSQLWDLNLSRAMLESLAAQLGMDVAFFIEGGTALATNYGEIITSLPPLKGLKFKIIPRSSIDPNKTKNAYANLDLNLCGRNLQKTKSLIEAIKNGDNPKILQNLHNDFEQTPGEEKCPCQVARAKAGNPKTDPLKQRQYLSGAGPSTFSVSLK